MEKENYQFRADSLQNYLLSGYIGDVYAYAKRHKMDDACAWFCQEMDSMLNALDVMATIKDEYIWKAFCTEVGKTERELKHIKDDYIGEVDLDE